MVAQQRVAFESQDDLQAEIEGLRQSLLSAFLPAVLATSWLWFSYVVIYDQPLKPNSAACLLLLLASYGARRLREVHHTAACWLLLVGMILAESLIAVAHPSSLAAAFGILVVIAANAFLGTGQALLVALLAWLGVGAARYATGDALRVAANGQVLTLYLLTAGASWLAARPLKTSVAWALAGWDHAHKALLEARERRGEMYRVVRALEEATYRLEHTNNELIVAQQEAELARALKGRFAATVSHELRAPLNLILGFSRLMALSPESYGEPLPRTYRADIDTIYRNSQHLVALVDDILDLSQIEAQRLPLVKDRIDLEEDVVKKAVSIVQTLAERKGLYLRLELAGNLPWILADQVRLRQALLNLLTNAIRFTEHGGITVRTSQQEGLLVVSVQDTGRGIAPEDMPKLFQEFHQVHTSETREGAGSGLGLSISKHLVELHGGQIWAESRQGVGTTLCFTVPLPETESVLATTVKTGDVHPTSRPHESCLIVHDDPGIMRLLARRLEGYRIVGTPNPQEALRLTDELHPRAILTTPLLADGLHYQFSQASFDVPIITCSLPRMAEQGRFQGVISYLVKPIAPEALATAMRNVERDGETTVLLVDDDPDAVDLLERMLTLIPRPYNILKAYDGLQALQQMQQIVPDVVFVDLVMPGVDGSELIARMRAEERTCKVPVVVVSAQGWIEDNATLGTLIGVSCREPLSLSTGIQCLKALLDALPPRYLAERAASELSVAGPLDRAASPTPQPPQAPKPIGIG